MPTIDLASVYVFDSAGRRTALHVDVQEEIEEPWDVFRGSVVPKTPLTFHRHSCSKPMDRIASTWVALELVSDRVVQTLRAGAFTGWSTYPVRVFGKDKREIPGYHGWSVTGRCGPIDRSLSQKIWADPTVPGGEASYKWKGLLFDPRTWDGSDIFCPKGTTFTFVTERVRDALERAKLTNIELEPITENLMLLSAG